MEPTGSILDEFPRFRWDIPYFAWRFFGVRVHPGQVRFAEAVIARNATGWRPRYTDVKASAGNRAGKTLVLAIVIFHSVLFKTNFRPPDYEDDASIRSWMRLAYDWYHFGIQQEIAELVFYELTALFEGRHKAQEGRGCPAVDELGPICVYDKKYRGEYPWVVVSPLFGGGQIHFRTTTERAIGSLGKDMAGISMDEGGFEPNLTWIIAEVLHLRRLSTGGQFLLISTPSEGFTEFKDEFDKGDPENPLRRPSHISIYISTRENIGYGISQEVFDTLVADMVPELIPQNIDGRFIQGTKAFFNAAAVDAAFVQSVDPDEQPYLAELTVAIKGHRYIQGIDPALTYDNTWSITLDVTDRKHITGAMASRLQGKQQTIAVVALAHGVHGAYSSEVEQTHCTTGLDVTGMGGKVFKDMLSGIPGLRGVEFGGTAKTKLRLLMDVKSLIEKGQIKFPRSGIWLELRRQLLAYRLQDRKLATDAVMALAVAVKLAIRLPEGPAASSQPFDYFGVGKNGPTDEERLQKMLGRRNVTVSRIKLV